MNLQDTDYPESNEPAGSSIHSWLAVVIIIAAAGVALWYR
jgi:hypothetical protein